MGTVVDLQPTWEAAMRILIACVRDAESEEAKDMAAKEILRGGKLLDQLIAESKPATEA